MTQIKCKECGEISTLKSKFEDRCPECGADEDDIIELSACEDDPADTELICYECGWEVESHVNVQLKGRTKQMFTVDDPCPVCEDAGHYDNSLSPKDPSRQTADLPEYNVARGAARKMRLSHTDGTVPVDVRAIAVALGFEIEKVDASEDALLIENVMEIPRGAPSAERFVIAHELGHAELKHIGDRQKVEPEANAFASELLIPRAQLNQLMRENPTLREVARHFDTSMDAAYYAVRAAKKINSLAR